MLVLRADTNFNIAKNMFKILTEFKKILVGLFSPKHIALLKLIFPTNYFYNITERLLIWEWKKRRKRHKQKMDLNSQNIESGINVIGYLSAVKGIGEAARNNILALNVVKIPYSTNDFRFGIANSPLVEDVPASVYGVGLKFNTNLVHLNPPQLPYLWGEFKEKNLSDRYTIGVWYWELPDFPKEWEFAFDLVDEVWAATNFIFDSVSAKSTVPVIRMPPCVQPLVDSRLKRSDFNLPIDRFLFMSAYDVLSVQARKNPFGAIEAFKRAFPENDSSVGLVIKVNNGALDSNEIDNLKTYIKRNSNIYLITDIYTKIKFNSLVSLMDVFVSLHRSEGFGLVPAEAMSFGKPVVMTNWSGNSDFMTLENSCGINYKLVNIKDDAGPYKAGQIWAEPDVDHAAHYMHELFHDKNYFDHVAYNARKTILANFSPEVVGQKIKSRMMEIGLM